MISQELFHRLRAAQLRSMREQEILSGRGWLLICGLAHILTAVYPLFLWFNVWMLRSQPLNQRLHPGYNAGLTLLSGALLLGFWWWARFAPYRAALAAMISYISIQGVLGFLDPHQLVASATIKALIFIGLIQAVRVGFRRHRPA